MTNIKDKPSTSSVVKPEVIDLIDDNDISELQEERNCNSPLLFGNDSPVNQSRLPTRNDIVIKQEVQDTCKDVAEQSDVPESSGISSDEDVEKVRNFINSYNTRKNRRSVKHITVSFIFQ